MALDIKFGNTDFIWPEISVLIEASLGRNALERATRQSSDRSPSSKGKISKKRTQSASPQRLKLVDYETENYFIKGHSIDDSI